MVISIIEIEVNIKSKGRRGKYNLAEKEKREMKRAKEKEVWEKIFFIFFSTDFIYFCTGNQYSLISFIESHYSEMTCPCLTFNWNPPMFATRLKIFGQFFKWFMKSWTFSKIFIAYRWISLTWIYFNAVENMKLQT